MRAVEAMKFEDDLGIMSFSDEPQWDFPIRTIGNSVGLGEALDAISRIQADGGTNMYQALDEAVSVLSGDAIGGNKFILLLTDGKSNDGDDETFNSLAAKAKQQGITISIIGLSDQVNTELLSQIAEAGQGHYYETKDEYELPGIMLSESIASRGEKYPKWL